MPYKSKLILCLPLWFRPEGFKNKTNKEMNEPYIIQTNGCNCLILASCLSDAKYKAEKMNGQIVKPYNIEDYQILKSINKKLKQ